MRAELREKVVKLLEKDQFAVLSTCGPVGIQAGEFPCQFYSDHLYFLVPATIDLLENLEECPDVLVTASEWQLSGKAYVCDLMKQSLDLALRNTSTAKWCRIIDISPKTVQLTPRAGWGFAETIDFE